MNRGPPPLPPPLFISWAECCADVRQPEREADPVTEGVLPGVLPGVALSPPLMPVPPGEGRGGGGGGGGSLWGHVPHLRPTLPLCRGEGQPETQAEGGGTREREECSTLEGQ